MPSPLEAAYMAQDVYNIQKSDILGPSLEGGWILKDLYINKEGLKIGVYSRFAYGVTEYALVNKGSSTKGDWVNNLQQPAGFSTDMSDSIEFAKKFVEEHNGKAVTMIGHSKGGGEAIANALATNQNAITFNTSKPNYKLYGLQKEYKNYSAVMRHYVVDGDVLTRTIGTPSIGELILLESQHPMSFFDSLKTIIEKSMMNHAMESVINALKNR